jgi:hypothetical protein
MPEQFKEARVLLAIQALQSNPKLRVLRAAKIYDVSENTFHNRINGKASKAETRPQNRLLNKIEEKVFLEHIIDLDNREFSPKVEIVEDMANSIFASRIQQCVGKLWAHRFIKRNQELKMRLSHSYDFQRALCEDPKLIETWFQRVMDIKAKYGIQDCDIWNFDETGFMIGVISPSIVITRADRKGRRKKVQPGNKEWATVIACINSEGCEIPPFLIVKGTYHLANWYSENDTLPRDWIVKPIDNGWTDNATGLEWIQHFEKHTLQLKKGAYRLLILDGHGSHISAEFEAYCKFHNIVTINLPPHSSHLLQPLDVECFSVLKHYYSQELEIFIKAYITHITKAEFLIAFQKAYAKTMTKNNIKAGFRGAGLVPLDSQVVISTLDVKLRTPTPTGPPNPDPWTSQTPRNSTKALSQTELVRAKITCHQGSSPTLIFEAMTQLAKGTEVLAHRLILAEGQISILEKANEALSKRRRAKKTRIRQGGTLSIGEAKDILTQKEIDVQIAVDQKASSSTAYRCSKCRRVGHNARTCKINKNMLELD